MFSPFEEKLLKALGRRKLKIIDLTHELENELSSLVDANSYVAGAIRRINRKCEEQELDWKIDGEGGGRLGRTVWKAKLHSAS